MTLILCPECHNGISDQADRCPHCGYLLKPMGNFYSEEKQKSGFEKFQEGLEGCSKDSFQFGCGCTVLMAILAILFFILLG